jgi:electron transfer flavoprotein alpha subunit
MGAVFGVTRPVAMNAWAPTHRLIGVSGARTAPAVCLVAGASGAPAFLWGIGRAGFIAAVDQDERAAIVSESDAAVLDDCIAVIEALADIASSERS